MPRITESLKGETAEKINQCLHFFGEKLEICKIEAPLTQKRGKLDLIKVKKVSWGDFLEHVLLKLQIYYMRSEGRKPGKKAKKKKREMYFSVRQDLNVLESGIILVRAFGLFDRETRITVC